jgi:hypothetical protein
VIVPSHTPGLPDTFVVVEQHLVILRLTRALLVELLLESRQKMSTDALQYADKK